MKCRRTLNQAIAIGALVCMTTQPTLAGLLNLARTPLFVGSAVPPKVLLTMSKDEQLYKKAYNDYTDLDGDGNIETTYKHSVVYYGYFDPYKCYAYSTSTHRFEPQAITATKYCSGAWSGNFLNWASMSRMDAVRKLLYGGMRSTDQTFAEGGVNAVTVLERAFLPPDAHAWAKYYNGPDLAQLTPFNPPSSAPLFEAPNTGAPYVLPTTGGTHSISFPAGSVTLTDHVSVGDQVLIAARDAPANYMMGAVISTVKSTLEVRVHETGIAGGGTSSTNWRVTNLSRTGISLCNVTTGSTSGADRRSSTNSRPPLIRVAQGNFALWNANERWQCLWSEEQNNTQGGFAGGLRSNGNQFPLSEIAASAENPSQNTHGLGSGSAKGEYIARVQVCKSDLLGTESCKQYPNGNYKPVGLLQKYGDRELIHFGLMTGSHAKNISGGVLRKNAGPLTDEVNVNTDGTFVQPYRPVGSPRTTGSAATPPGIINTLNYMRIYGYDYNTGSYLGGNGDSCTYQLTSITENTCTAWGNPISEIFFEALRYFAGRTPTAEYTYGSGSKDNELGLPLAAWSDPVSSGLYCAPLNAVVFNASVSSADDDLRAGSAAAINAAGKTIKDLTDTVGQTEGIHGGSYFIGKLVGESPTPTGNLGFELCTPKNISALGDVSGICPEGPTLGGSYLIAGLAHHARTNRIRTDIAVPAHDTRSLTVTTHAIQLATNVPQIIVPVPGDPKRRVVIQPVYRLNLGAGNVGGGALVDMRIVRQETVGTISRGKIYVNWEDSEQGGDYDQDMWGTMEWVLDASKNTISITTNAISASSSNPQGFGYAISGTTQDGPHFHSGIYGFNFTDPTGVLGCTTCQVAGASSGQRGPQSWTYTLGTTAAHTLHDPLWYAAKYGGFVDHNGNKRPDLLAEWDSRLTDGSPGQDGIPDNYFLVTNPLGLEAALDRAFHNILANSSWSSIATNSSALQTLSAIYQARFNTTDWSGQLLSYSILADGSISSTPAWDAGQVLNKQAWHARTILTFNNRSDVRKGVRFRWPVSPESPTAAEISPALVSALDTSPETHLPDGRGEQRLRYLRGDGTHEIGPQHFRARPTSKLGDIVHSNPVYVGTPSALIVNHEYATFRENHLKRTPMIYVGANDGMLHGFDAATGQERLAYVPSRTFPFLTELTSPNYARRYYVDGAPEVRDAVAGGTWRTVLVGGLAGGGQGLYALDVTDPDQFNEANAANIVLWEFNDTDDPELGYVYGKPLIARMANGKWAAIVSGGYNTSEGDGAASKTGHAHLFVIFLDGPTGPNRTWVEGVDYVKISTGVGETSNPNALAAPFPADVNVDGMVDYVYAGDLRGNLWKFDLTHNTPKAWSAATNRVRLFEARDANGDPQPITAPVEGTLHPSGQGYIIAFGTGKYVEPSDTSGPYVGQSFYGIWDKHDKPSNISTQTRVTARNQLLQQTITEVASGDHTFRVLSQNAPDWSSAGPPPASDAPPKHLGWFMDFPNSATSGERSVAQPLLMYGRLIFVTIVPEGGACSLGGKNHLMIVDPRTGGRIDAPVLDVNGDGTLNADDRVTVGATKVYASGIQAAGIAPTPAVVISGFVPALTPPGSHIYGTPGSPVEGAGLLLAYAIGGNSMGGRTSTVIGLGSNSGRVSWREVLSR